MIEFSELTPHTPDTIEVREENDGYIVRNHKYSVDVYLNTPSALVWGLCDGAHTVRDIIAEVEALYPEEAMQVAEDVNAIIMQFIEQGVICFDAETSLPRAVNQLIDLSDRKAEQRKLESEGIEATPVTARHLDKRLTVAMATYDDFDGVYFTVQSLRVYHPELYDELEILVLDNNPLGKAGGALRELAKQIPNMRYIPEVLRAGTSVRDCLFSLANSEYVVCIDCHVMIFPGALAGLLKHYESNPKTSDLIQGPLIYDDLKTMSTHFKHIWQGGMFGVWENDQRGLEIDGDPFDIPMQGLGLFSCRKSAWPGFNPAFQGFGGEEGYIHEKFRQAGGRTICLPALRWLHRFLRPAGVPYKIRWEDRIMNYLIGFNEVGWNTTPIKEHFTEFLNAEVVERCVEQFRQEFGYVPN